MYIWTQDSDLVYLSLSIYKGIKLVDPGRRDGTEIHLGQV